MIDMITMVLILVITFAAAIIILIYFRDKLSAIGSKQVKSVPSVLELLEGQDYNTYIMRPMERGLYIASAALLLLIIGYVFYRSWIAALMLTPMAIYYPKIRKRQIIDKRKRELKLQFKDVLQSLSSSLQAGKSLEVSLSTCIKDMEIQYEADAFMIKELYIIIRKLEANETVERAFAEFARRSHIDEIISFAEVLEICKRSGGNLIVAIRNSTDIISDKIEVFNEIQGILAQKKLEQKILAIMPIIIILMLSISAMDFMQPVFTQTVGKVVMTVSLVLFAVAYVISDKITNIEV